MLSLHLVVPPTLLGRQRELAPPTLVALRNVKAYDAVADTTSVVREATLLQTAQYFSCDLVSTTERGLWLKPSPYSDERFISRAREAARKFARDARPGVWSSTLSLIHI